MNKQLHSRLALAAMALAVAFAGYYFVSLTHRTIEKLEARAISGDFPVMHLEEGAAVVDENGLVENHRAAPGILRYVATTRLVPPGKYVAVIVATDGIEEHRKKSEIVIAARDPLGAWHPASADKLSRSLGKN